MAGVEWVWTKGTEASFLALPELAVQQAMASLVADIKGIIDRAVTRAKQLSADRVLTGRMISAISGEVEYGARHVGGRFGFLGEVQDYFVYQTVSGFHHVYSGDYIEPTFALRDAGENALADIDRAVVAAIASINI